MRTTINVICGFFLGTVLSKAGGWATVLGLVCVAVIVLNTFDRRP